MSKRMEYMAFGDKVRQQSVSKKMTLRHVANKIEVDPSLLAKVERNERQPTKESINIISR